MRSFLSLILAALFLSISSVASGQQVSSGPPFKDSDRPSGQSSSQETLRLDPADCSRLLNAALAAKEAAERDRQQLQSAADRGSGSAISSAGPFPSDLRQDLMVLQQREDALNRCASASHAPVDVLIPDAACSGEQIVKFQMAHEGEPAREVPIQHLPGTSAFYYEAGMTIDADGAPNAYHPDNTGLDDLANAGGPGNWEGLAKNRYGDPFVQGPDDPFPGYYISATALVDRDRPLNDPLRYVDASKIPYIVLPGGMARELGARPGDFSVVLNQRNAKMSYAIFGDVGPWDRIGEGSVALAENLGIRSNARNGGARGGILYLVFPGSGNGRPRPIEEINAEAEKLFHAWGGSDQLAACKFQVPDRLLEGNRSTN
jgi:Fungal chitosanase of glycosyl hydrolase group 75